MISFLFNALASICYGVSLFLFAWCFFEIWDRIAQRTVGTQVIRLRALRVASEQIQFFFVVWAVVVAAILFSLGQLMPLVAVMLIAISFPFSKQLFDGWISARETVLRVQLLKAASGMANGAISGVPALTIFREMTDVADQPLKGFFEQIVAETDDRIPFPDAIARTTKKLELDTFTLFATCTTLHHSAGGKSREAWIRIGHALDEMDRVEKKISSDSAGGRYAVYFLAVMPLLFVGMFAIAEPPAVELLFGTFLGQVCVAIVIGVIYAAISWAMQIVDVKV